MKDSNWWRFVALVAAVAFGQSSLMHLTPFPELQWMAVPTFLLMLVFALIMEEVSKEKEGGV